MKCGGSVGQTFILCESATTNNSESTPTFTFITVKEYSSPGKYFIHQSYKVIRQWQGIPVKEKEVKNSLI